MYLQIKEELAEILECAHNGVVIVDRTGRIAVFNESARSLSGLSKAETIGRHIAEFFPESWRDMELIISDKTAQVGKKVAIGSSNVIANRNAIVKGGQVMGVLSIFQSALELETLAADLEAYKHLSEELDVIINSSHDGLWISDAQGKTLRVNPASAKFAGIKPEEAVGMKMADLVAAGYFDRSATLEVLKRGSAVSFMQTQKDGKRILVTGNPVYDEAGKIRLVVVNARDLSALNRLQAELEASQDLNRQYRRQVSELHHRHRLESELIIRSAAMERIFDTALRVSQVDTTVLIDGESGVGKGLLANVIHQASARKDGPMMRVDCGAIPESLIEAELFGYVKGAFTGALDNGKPGYFELANGGTLFLDEVGELPLKVQARLLRFLEGGEMVRLGSTTTCKIDTRIIAATNRDLKQMVAEKKFRKDLFFRLSVVPIRIPPLRQRLEDIPPLVNHFLNIFNEKCSTEKRVSPVVVDNLCNYHFPGNVRELANLMERLVVLSKNDVIEMSDLPASIRQARVTSCLPGVLGQWNLPRAVSQLESEMILEALKTFDSQREAARQLGIDPSTLSRKIKRHNLHHAISQHVAIHQ